MTAGLRVPERHDVAVYVEHNRGSYINQFIVIRDPDQVITRQITTTRPKVRWRQREADDFFLSLFNDPDMRGKSWTVTHDLEVRLTEQDRADISVGKTPEALILRIAKEVGNVYDRLDVDTTGV